MSFDEEQDGISLGELDSVSDLSQDETDAAEAAATEEVDDSQLSEGDAMRRRSAARRAERDRKKARRKELRSKNPEHGKGRRIATIVIALALCVCLVAGGVYYFYFRGKDTSSRVAGNGPDTSMDFGNITVISASGTTSIGMSMETFELNLSDVDLTIEEVYVSNRDEVEEGQAILKINEDSIESARTSLQQAAKSAEYAYQLNEIDAQEDVIEAKDTYEQALIELEYAEQDYADTISEAQAEIDSLEDQIEEQQELVDEYQAAVDDDDYYNKEYKVAELKAQLEKDQTLLQEIYDDTSNGVQDHLDYVSNGSYESWKAGTQSAAEETTEVQAADQEGGSGMPGGMQGPPGDMNPPSNPEDPGQGGTEDPGEGDTGSTEDPGEGDTGSTEDPGEGDSGDTGDTGDSGDGTSTTSETVSNAVTEARNIITYKVLTARSETTSETVTNKTYYTSGSMPSGSAGSVPSGSASGSSSSSGATPSASSSSGSVGSSSGSSSSSSSGATISDEYESTSSNTGNSLSTSSLTTEDITTWPWYAAYVALDEEVTEEHEEYEAAVTKAERAQKRASSLLPQAKNKLESLQLQLRTAQNNLITTKEEAQETLDTAKATATAAEETYNTSIRNIENTADTLKDAMDEADENLEAFEEQIGDGYLYTSNAGTIMMVNAEEGTTLTYNQVIVAYTDPGTISVTAAVDQSNIASITVGDTTAVVFEDAGIYQGFVSAINPVTQSSSRTSVTYSVTITLKGDVSAVSENISATIYFGDAVPLVFEQAGDQYHDPDASTTSSSTTSDSSTGSSSSTSDADTSALETLIEQTDESIESGDNTEVHDSFSDTETTDTTDNEPGIADADMLLDNMMVNEDGTNYVPDTTDTESTASDTTDAGTVTTNEAQ